MSNLPAVHSLAVRAAVNTSIVSRLTVTGARPAAAFSRTTSLPSFQTESSDSSRSNSRDTRSAAALAFLSSVAQIATRNEDPIAVKSRSTSVDGAGAVEHAHTATIGIR
jgi:hypothetical protein